MPKISLLFLFALTSTILFSLGCSSNTVWDDGSYRTIGHSNPRPKPSTVSLNTAADDGDIQLSPSITVSNGAIKPPHNPNHLVRYGHPKIIQKIIKTAQIHCQVVHKKVRSTADGYWGQYSGIFKQCVYRFPDHCGGHQFAVLDFNNKKALVYLQENDQRYVIDLIQGTPDARAGLWDMDDRIGTRNTNLGYVFESQYNLQSTENKRDPALMLGWVIQASASDETSYGRSYHHAIQEVLDCF
ncbi:MAG: hypothetical protein MI976_05655 [Pseudomonadales bacterium]|nr:hypothetical protein [Pseudomonadales bacterium]